MFIYHDTNHIEQHVLGSKLGAHPELESGLNEKQYILPGAGGLGEVLTNAFI